jgi:diguanylate cyclase (GGDEF)-like protein
MAAGAVLLLAHLAAAVLGAPPAVGAALYVAGTASAPVLIVLGIRRNRPDAWLPWALIAAGAALSTAGDVLYALVPQLFGPVVDPQWANLPYLLRFPLFAAGLTMLLRRRTPGRDRPAIVDGALLAVSVSLVSWVFVIDPVRDSMSGHPAGLMLTLESMAFPIGDLLLLVLGVRLMLGGGFDLLSLRLFSAHLVLFCSADTSYTMRLLNGDFDYPWLLEAAWMGASLLLGLAALDPSMRPLGDRTLAGDQLVTTGRLVLLGGASLLAPLTLVIQFLRGGELHILLTAASCSVLFLLVITRLAGLAQAQRHAAITDGLTGLHTRRYFTETLGTECSRANRGGEPLSLILLDVDHFKKVNDTYGHTAGDRVLVEVARRLRAAVRGGDIVARYGGEEFAVLLPRTRPADARIVAERLRTSVMNAAVAIGGAEEIGVTVSLGLAALPVHADTPADLVNLADTLLYASKQGGRNQVTAAPTSIDELVPGEARVAS